MLRDMEQSPDIRADERRRIARALTSFFEREVPGTYRVLIKHLGLDYTTGIDEGWHDFINAVADHDARMLASQT